jgi:purine-nucleoside/S-methyl-5'-thioadenosine phosphorylase / adenosine deaminase
MVSDREPQPVQSPLLDAVSEGSSIRHGFFSRDGGVSEGIYSGLNVGLGSDDDPERVKENRARVAAWFGLAPDRLATLHQVHSADVHVATAENVGERPRCDGVVTREPGIILGVLAADCGPVLFCDAENGVIGAAHAGWRGAFDGVLENTVAKMEELGADRTKIVACLGPSISQKNYEVGPEFIGRAITADKANERWFVPSERDGHAMFDLRGMTVDRLDKAGIRAAMIDACTYADEEAWFSYRRTTHRGEPDYGRQMSAIAIGS